MTTLRPNLVPRKRNKKKCRTTPPSPKTAFPSSSASAKSSTGPRTSPPAWSRWRCSNRRCGARKRTAAAKLLGELGSLDVVNFLSWRYRDPEKQLAERLGAKPAHCYYGPVGGESPIRYLHEAAQRIARGECSVAAVCGAEAQSTATKAERGGIDAALDAVRP